MYPKDFQNNEEHYKIDSVEEELADILVYCRNLLDRLGLNEDDIVNRKMEKNARKYPVDKVKGNAKKYTEL